MAGLDAMRHRAERCVTHHHACDCREFERALLVEVERAGRAVHAARIELERPTGGKFSERYRAHRAASEALTEALAALDDWRSEVGAYGD